MALGGGIFLTQNKVLPGAYINFVSAARASATLSERGYCAMALELDWGPDGVVFTVENGDFQTDSQKIFGYDYTSDKLKGLRDLFLNAKTLYAYRLNGGTKAANTFATAKYSGVRGNDIKITVSANVDDESKFDVTTLLETQTMDQQTVATAAELQDNDYVVFQKSVELTETAATPLTGGTNGESVLGADHQAFLDKIESYSFNTMGCLSTEEAVKDLYTAFTKRMRDECGVKFQTVLYQKAADYEGIINVKNKVSDDNEKESSLIYFITGISAGCAVNRSNTNQVYSGNYTVDTSYKQSELAQAIQTGEMVLHKVGDEVRILEDVNSFTSVTIDKNSDFQSNQTIRVLDQIGNDIAVLFNTQYLGKVPNNDAGRTALWNDIVTYNKELMRLEAIENFVAEDVSVEKGNDKKSVIVTNQVTPVNAMSKLYMTVIVA